MKSHKTINPASYTTVQDVFPFLGLNNPRHMNYQDDSCLLFSTCTKTLVIWNPNRGVICHEQRSCKKLLAWGKIAQKLSRVKIRQNLRWGKIVNKLPSNFVTRGFVCTFVILSQENVHLRLHKGEPRSSSEGREFDDNDVDRCHRRLPRRRDPALGHFGSAHHLLKANISIFDDD